MYKVLVVDTEEKMKQWYIDYSMSVIGGRALPDVRDGLKPVHRRILFSMYELGITPDKAYRKCARIVGDVLGKYHPHGDTSVYDALVRMAQDFSQRYTLVNGHGNFGSVDGDSAAAMRYTEAKMGKIAMAMVNDINKDTVDFMPNFDGSEKEPTVLPASYPNLIVNGCEGIAVGMSTSIPPHNLGEVIDGTIYLIDNPECTISELTTYIKAPDFPTGAEIINYKNMKSVYETGSGKVVIRAKHHMEDEGNKKLIVITEIPYQVNKAKLVEEIYLLTKPTKKTSKKSKKEVIIPAICPEISDIRDESDREGMRIVIELKKDIDEEYILNMLYKYSKLQINYSVNMLTLVNEEPLVLNLKQTLNYFIDFKKTVVTRRTNFELNKANERLIVLEGLKKGLDNIDKTIEIIRKSETTKEAKVNLMNNLIINEIQAQAILNMRLHKLTSLEKCEIIEEYKEVLENIENLKSILQNESVLIDLVKTELMEVKDKYVDERKTELKDIEIETVVAAPKVEEIKNYNIVTYLTKDGYLKKVPSISLRGNSEFKLKDNDYIIREIQGENIDDILLFTNQNNIYRLKSHKVPDKKLSEMGEYTTNVLNLKNDEKVIDMVTTNYSDKDENLLIFYENGNVARINMDSYKSNYGCLKCNAKSKIVKVEKITKDVDLLLVTNIGKALIFNSNQITTVVTSRTSVGTRAIKLKDENKLVYVGINYVENDTLTMRTKKQNTMNSVINNLKYYTGTKGNAGVILYNCKKNDDEILEIIDKK